MAERETGASNNESESGFPNVNLGESTEYFILVRVFD